MFTYRQELIINKLLHSVSPINQQILAHQLEISERTLRKDIFEINEALRHFNLSVLYTRKKGYYILDDERIKIKEIILDNERYSDNVPENSYQRKLYILFELLWEKDYISLNNVANEIFVSKTTTYNDFLEINNDLYNNFNINLEISKTKGYRLNCNEILKRKILEKIVQEHKSRYKYLMKIFVKYNIYYQEQFKTLNDVIYKWAKDNNITINKMEVINFSLEIQIIFRRYKDGFFVDKINSIDNVYKFPISEIENIMDIKLCENEMYYIFEVVKNKSFIINYNNEKLQYSKEITSEFIEYICQNLQEKFYFNESELLGFESYISSMLKTLSKNIHEDVYNELVVKTEYPLFYNLAEKIQPIINKYYNFQLTEGDIETITLYLVMMIRYQKFISKILLVSDYKNILLSLFIKKFERFFGESMEIVKIIDTKTFVDNYNKYDYDYIISTNLIKTDIAIDVIYVDIIFKEADILKIVNVFKL